MKRIWLGWCLVLMLSSACQEKQSSIREKQTAIQKPPFAVGYQCIQASDTSRIYQPGTPEHHKLHYRPLDIDVWYPAVSAKKDSVLKFKNILGLLEERATIYSAPKTFPGLTKDVAKSFTEGFNCSSPELLLNYPTRSYKKSPAIKGKFPLIIYLASYNALSYDNYIMLEEFARQGFVVACVSSIGKYPGDMTMKTADLMEQVHDAAFTLDRLKQLTFVDTTRIGVLGYSWGGFAAGILAMVRPDIDALVSLDGSEFHRYGSSAEEDADFDATITGMPFKNALIKVPYLRLESNPEAKKINKNNDTGAVFNFTEKLAADKQIYKVNGADHQDFSCLPTVVKASGHCKGTPTYGLITNLTVQYFREKLKGHQNAFKQALEPELGKTIIPVLAP